MITSLVQSSATRFFICLFLPRYPLYLSVGAGCSDPGTACAKVFFFLFTLHFGSFYGILGAATTWRWFGLCIGMHGKGLGKGKDKGKGLGAWLHGIGFVHFDTASKGQSPYMMISHVQRKPYEGIPTTDLKNHEIYPTTCRSTLQARPSPDCGNTCLDLKIYLLKS